MVVPPVSAVAGSPAVSFTGRPGSTGPAATVTALPAFAALLAGEASAVPQSVPGGEKLPPPAAALPAGTAAASPGDDLPDGGDVMGGDVTAVAAAPVGDPAPLKSLTTGRATPVVPALGGATRAQLAMPPSEARDAMLQLPDRARDSTTGTAMAADNAPPVVVEIAGTAPDLAAAPAAARPGVKSAVVASQALPDNAAETRQFGLPDKPAVTDIGPGQAASGDDGSGVVDLESLMRLVQQTGRKPLPDGILRALEAQQSRMMQPPPAVAAPIAATPGETGIPAAVPEIMPGFSRPSTPVVATAMAGMTEGTMASRAGNFTATVGGLPGGATEVKQPSAQSTVSDSAKALTDIAQAVPELAGAESAGDEMSVRLPASNSVSAPSRSALAGSLSLPPGLAPGTPAWGQAVGERLLMMSTGGVQVAELRLDPPELGSLHVRLQVQQDQVSLHISSPHAQVRDALEQQMPRLREMLAEQGLNLGNGTVADDSGRRDRQAGESTGAGLVASDSGEVATPAAVTVSRVSLVDQYV